MIRVQVIAPSPAMRAGLTSMLAGAPGIVVVTEAASQSAPVHSSHEPDVVVLASPPASRAGPELLSDKSPGAPILYLSNDALDVRALMGNGTGWGLLPLDASADELQAAVRALAAGLLAASPRLISDTAEQVAHGGPLTERETEVLGLLSKGLANKQIAAALAISEHTVKFHISSIYSKLNATNRTQAVHEGLRNGWIVL